MIKDPIEKHAIEKLMTDTKFKLARIRWICSVLNYTLKTYYIDAPNYKLKRVFSLKGNGSDCQDMSKDEVIAEMRWMIITKYITN